MLYESYQTQYLIAYLTIYIVSQTLHCLRGASIMVLFPASS